MTVRDRFLQTLNFEKPHDRLPMVEWAAWWDQTLDRWKTEGLPADITWDESLTYFDLDPLICIGIFGKSKHTPSPSAHGAPIITNEAEYLSIKSTLYTEKGIERACEQAQNLQKRHERGEVIIRIWLDGFFWFARSLLGIEGHLYAFYDQPDLLHRINTDLTHYLTRAFHALCNVIRPDMVGYAEDMSYNHGPMLSYDLFKEFLLPYYRQLNPIIRSKNIKILIDSDGDVTDMVPWFEQAQIDGVYPLERQAGVDLIEIRKRHPKFLMLGGYDKMVMSVSEEAMRGEFERLLPVMRQGGYIPSVDHQTPPGVSLANYIDYIRLFKEYAKKAVL